MPVLINELICKVLNTSSVNELLKRFGSIKLIDSTTISMSLNLYQWVLFRSTKAGIKIHAISHKLNISVKIYKIMRFNIEIIL